MSTNFYLIRNRCGHCGRGDRLHIGKRSGGWQFLFHAIPGMMSARDWRYATAQEGVVIEDEYGELVAVDEFWRDVEATRRERLNHHDYCLERGLSASDSFKDHDGWPLSTSEFS